MKNIAHTLKPETRRSVMNQVHGKTKKIKGVSQVMIKLSYRHDIYVPYIHIAIKEDLVYENR
jgi:hypothetical protein